MDIEDKVHVVNPVGETSRIFVVHQAAQRLLRKDIVAAMKKNVKEVETFDLEEMQQVVEHHAVDIEAKLLKIISEEIYGDQESGYKVPIFDFEIN